MAMKTMKAAKGKGNTNKDKVSKKQTKAPNAMKAMSAMKAKKDVQQDMTAIKDSKSPNAIKAMMATNTGSAKPDDWEIKTTMLSKTWHTSNMNKTLASIQINLKAGTITEEWMYK